MPVSSGEPFYAFDDSVFEAGCYASPASGETPGSCGYYRYPQRSSEDDQPYRENSPRTQGEGYYPQCGVVGERGEMGRSYAAGEMHERGYYGGAETPSGVGGIQGSGGGAYSGEGVLQGTGYYEQSAVAQYWGNG